MRRYFEAANIVYPLAESLLPSPRRLLDLMNVKYLVTFSPSAEDSLGLGERDFRLVFVDGAYQVFENRSVWPRAFLARRVVWAGSAAEALESLGGLREAGGVVLEDPERRGGVEEHRGGRAVVRVYEYNKVIIDTLAPEQTVLILSDNYSPGWTATVNGRHEPILPANYAFRGVRIPAGAAHVVFRYRTPGLTLGALVSAGFTALLIVGMTGWPWNRRWFRGRDV